jgi:glucuronokinase
MIIKAAACPRAGLIGNPSDGYFGKTIAFTFDRFRAEVTLYETPELEILPNSIDHSVFASMDQLAADVRHYGYYGGIRLLKASVKRFHEYCVEQDLALDKKNFTIRYRSDIPHRVGLAGSSAIITACFRALMEFYGVAIPKTLLPNLILSVETRELNIPAGLQDRVAQVYEGMTFMDFDRALMEKQGHGSYESLSADGIPGLYIAYLTSFSEGTEVLHSDLRMRYERGDAEVAEAMRTWAGLAERAAALIRAGRGSEIGPLLDANFDLRRKLCPISEENLRLVDTARSVGASAKFSGSGGAIVGLVENDRMLEALTDALRPLPAEVFTPVICGDCHASA